MTIKRLYVEALRDLAQFLQFKKVAGFGLQLYLK